MQNKSFFSLSWPLMKECCRMYWYIPALSFIVYCFAGIFPIVSNLTEIGNVEHFVIGQLKNFSFVYCTLLFLVPLGAGLLMMGFLHKHNKALMLHSQPLSKNRIFNTYCLTGWLMCQLPIVLMALLYLILMPKVAVIRFSMIVYWALSSVAITTFFYGLVIIAGSLTGTTVMNLLTTGVLLVIIPMLMLTTQAYCEISIMGYAGLPEEILKIAYKSNPILTMIVEGSGLSYKECLLYFAVGGVLIAFARLIYKTRKLELVGTSVLSKSFEEVMTYLIVFVGMSGFGLLAWTFADSKASIIFGMVVGTLFTFSLVKIIVNRSIKIVNKKTLRSLGIYVCIAAVFVSVTVFDITGSTKRVPAVEDVQSVDVTNLIEGHSQEYRPYGHVSKEYADLRCLLTSPEAIELLTGLHQYVVDNEIYADGKSGEGTSLYDANDKEVSLGNQWVNITYNLKNGATLSRRYNLWLDDNVAQMLEDLETCTEYKEKKKITSYINMDKIDYIKITKMDVETGDYAGEDYSEYNGEDYAEQVPDSRTVAVMENPAVIRETLEAWEKDITGYGYKYNNRSQAAATDISQVEIYFSKEESPLLFYVSTVDKNLITYLTEKGYGPTVGVE